MIARLRLCLGSRLLPLRFRSVALMRICFCGAAVGLSLTVAGCGGVASSGDTTAPPPAVANVPTWHSDNARSGLNASETALTPQTVTPQSFQKLFSYNVDGYVYAQPLIVSGLMVNGATHNVVFVATENDSVYAFDADVYGTGTPLWQVSLLKSGEEPLVNGPIQPLEGVTSTPSIDVKSNILYVVSMQATTGNPGTFRLHALDLTTGAETNGGPVEITAQVNGTNQDNQDGIVHLTTACLQRAALLLANGSVYVGFGSCHSGWLLSYDATTLSPVGVVNMSPNLNGEGPYASAGGVWMGGGGPAADDSGNIYVTTGNGPYDPSQMSYGDSVMKFDSQLNLIDSFTPYDFQYMDCADADLAAGGLLLIPGSTNALAGGKTGKLYLVNTTNLGGEQQNDAGVTQTLWFEPDLSAPYSKSCVDNQGNTWTTDVNSYEIFGTAAYFNRTVYLGVTPTAASVPGPLRAFTYNGQLAAGPYTSDNILQSSYGTTPFISANGNAGGVIWMIDHGEPIQEGAGTTAILRAFDAGSLTEIYNSNDNAGDAPGYGIKFTSPIVANGKVYMGTGHDPLGGPNPQGELDVYGLKAK